MKTLKVPLKEAEKAKQQFKDSFDRKYTATKDEQFIYFPLLKAVKSKYAICNKRLKNREKETTESYWAKHLTKKELRQLKKAYDLVGTIAIIEIPAALLQKEKTIAKAMLLHRNIKTVLKKGSAHEGVFRAQKMKYLAGIKTTEALHKENKTRISVDVEKVYFSVRLAEERKRIAQLVQPGESILVMFSGCGVYPAVLARNTNAKEIIGVEINPEGHAYGLKNIKLNRLRNVTLYCGDAKTATPQKTFDRIIMPLPKTAETFLDVALARAKEGTAIHLYQFEKEENFAKAAENIKSICRKQGWTANILHIQKVGQQSPRVYRICIDMTLTKHS
ncbi:class I SAM-dependent methyltransferase family protein [Candidatus Woesearchaeota archaeon]|nr:MAG: class I SAM-dependent methyltransferase family protein [Candidatus Woesearchaeota archaeon]